MSYYYNHHQPEVTFREVIVSIIIICVLTIIGLNISNRIHNHIVDGNNKYETAVQIDNNEEQFGYALKTNFGDALVYGHLDVVDEVNIDDVRGMYVSRELEKYTRHTRTVSYKCGKQTCHRTEVYWTWDHVKTDATKSGWVTFCGQRFSTYVFPIPGDNYVKTVSAGHHLRHVYRRVDSHYIGTLYSFVDKHTINNPEFKPNVSIDSAVETFKTGFWPKYMFWVIWIILSVVGVVYFCYAENAWLNEPFSGDDDDD